MELKIKPRTEIKTFESDLHERLFVVDSNLNRRHLNDYQRAKLALWAKPILEEIAKRNMKSGGDKHLTPLDPIGRVNEEIGDRAKLSHETIRKAELIIKYNTSKEIEQKLETGKTTINAVFNDLKNVDLVLQAHSHNYQRTYPIKYNDKDPSNPIITDKNEGEYTNPDGTVFAVIGTAGADLHNFTGQAPYVGIPLKKS